MASILGLASETGSILDSYKRYLRDRIDLDLNREFLRVELGDLLWYVAVVASACDLTMAEIAKANLAKRHSGKNTAGCFVQSGSNAPSDIVRDFAHYQYEASKSGNLSQRGPESRLEPLCGLAHATGRILNSSKGKVEIFASATHRKFLRTELGDLLWYVSAVATVSDLNLGDIAEENLRRTHDLYPERGKSFAALVKTVPRLDDPENPAECFPRYMVIRFVDGFWDEHEVATQTIVFARPYAFPDGPIPYEEDGEKKFQGFALDTPLGNETDDNSRKKDGYRFHDAIHMGFMAVLGWSPTMRALLRIKRKSEREKDRTEDGARAVFTEEGLSAILARLASRRMGFQGENVVDGEILDTIRALVEDKEVNSVPGWLWRRAISHGFRALKQLIENKGGYLIADLDARKLTYSKGPPNVPTKKRN